MSSLLALLLTCSAVVATIHDDRRQAFRSAAAERLPEQVEDLIWDFYPKVKYGDHPKSPILSLEDTQALFPPLHLEGVNEDTVWYRSEPLNERITKDRYLTLYVTESTDRSASAQDDVRLYFKTDSYCELEIRYFIADEKVQQWSGGILWPYLFYSHFFTYDFAIKKARMNREQEPGTEILLYIPQGCTLALVKVSRVIAKQYFNSQAEGIPANISWATQLPPLPPPQEKRSFISIITEWIKQL